VSFAPYCSSTRASGRDVDSSRSTSSCMTRISSICPSSCATRAARSGASAISTLLLRQRCLDRAHGLFRRERADLPAVLDCLLNRREADAVDDELAGLHPFGHA